MSDERVSVVEAAEIAGVHPQRIHQRIRSGSLPASKVGNQWAVEVGDLRNLEHHSAPGRPMSSKSAWDLLAVALGDEEASQLSPSARSRARSRLRNLLALADSADLEAAAAQIVKALRNRARRDLFVASARDLADLSDDERVHLSGVSLSASNLSFGDLVEAYASADDVEGLMDDYLLSPAARARANVILHVVSHAREDLGLMALDAVARSPLARAVDLAEHDGIREKSEAVRALAEMREALVARASHIRGTGHD